MAITIRSHFLWVNIARIAGVLLNYLALALISYTYSSEEFGAYYTIISASYLLSAVLNFGLTRAFLAGVFSDNTGKKISALYVIISSSTAMFVSATIINYEIASLLLMSSVVSNCTVIADNLKGQLKSAQGIFLEFSLIPLCILIFLFYFNTTDTVPINFYAFIQLTFTTLNILYLVLGCVFITKFATTKITLQNKNVIKLLTKYWLTGILNVGASRSIGVLMLIMLGGEDKALLAAYIILSSPAGILLNIAQSYFAPKVSLAYQNKDLQKARAYLKNSRYFCSLLFLPYAVLAALNHDILLSMFNISDGTSTKGLLIVLLVSQQLRLCSGIIDIYLSMTNRANAEIISNLISILSIPAVLYLYGENDMTAITLAFCSLHLTRSIFCHVFEVLLQRNLLSKNKNNS